MAILKSDYSVSLCPFSKKRSKKKMNKELDNKKSISVEDPRLLTIKVSKMLFLKNIVWPHLVSQRILMIPVLYTNLLSHQCNMFR